MVEQFGEHVDRHPGVGVPLGVGVPVGVEDDPAFVIFAAAASCSRASEVIQSRCAVDSPWTAVGRRPSRLPHPVGSSFSSLTGVCGNWLRTRCCWARTASAVEAGMGSRRPRRFALWLS